MTIEGSEYFEICIPCQSSEVDSIESFLFNIGACSVTFRDAEDKAILEPKPGQMPLWLELEITAMYSLKEYQHKRTLNQVVSRFSDRKIVSKNLENQVWERTWLKHFKPMKFGSNTWIIPSEYEPQEASAINIYLDPGLAFGTGTHATTALCLEWIDGQNLKNDMIVDFGCGSGILAIAALKHGAKKVFCTDIDPQAIESTLVNSAKNKVQNAIEVVETVDVDRMIKLDVVMANILAAPLMGLAETFNDMLKPGGKIIMSGILKEQADEIIEKYSGQFIDFQINIKDDWVSINAKKINND